MVPSTKDVIESAGGDVAALNDLYLVLEATLDNAHLDPHVFIGGERQLNIRPGTGRELGANRLRCER